MNVSAPTIVLVVSSAYWCLMPAELISTSLVSLHQHGFLAIITFADMLLLASPIRWFHIFPVWLFAGSYASYTYFSFRIWGEYKLFLLEVPHTSTIGSRIQEKKYSALFCDWLIYGTAHAHTLYLTP